MKSTYASRILIAAAIFFMVGGVRAQEVFHNPAMEGSEEFQKAYGRAQELAGRGRFDEAIAELKNAAKAKDGKCPECFQMIGQIHINLGEYPDAAAAYREALRLDPSNAAELHNACGVALYMQKDKALYGDAVVEFKQAIELSKGHLNKAYYNLGFALIKAGKTQEGTAVLKTYLEKQPDAAEAAEIRAVLANPGKAGEPFAPVFSVKSTKGEELSLEKLKGKVVLLDFWASWCGPCRADMPEVRKIYKKYKSDQFVMIGINLDKDRRAFEEYVQEEGITWPQYFDGSGWNNKVSRIYRVTGIPHSVLIDQDGIIRATGLRAARLSNAIGDLLKKSQSSGKSNSGH